MRTATREATWSGRNYRSRSARPLPGLAPVPQDGLSAVGELGRCCTVVGSVEDAVVEDSRLLLGVAFGSSDRGQVEERDFFEGGGEDRDLGRSPCYRQLAGLQAEGGEEVGDVDDGAEQVLVQPVAVEHPSPAAGPELLEGPTADQGQGSAEVGDPVVAAGFAADPEP